MTDDELDAYDVLRITRRPRISSSKRPTGPWPGSSIRTAKTPDVARMSEINRAYDLVRTTERRKRYDRLHRIRPMGPGAGRRVAEHGGPGLRRTRSGSVARRQPAPMRGTRR